MGAVTAVQWRFGVDCIGEESCRGRRDGRAVESENRVQTISSMGSGSLCMEAAVLTASNAAMARCPLAL